MGFMFFIVVTVVGSISSYLISWFGFPYEWSSLITLPLIGASVWLIYRGYSFLAWGLLGCIGVAAISGIALLRGYTVSEPDVPANMPDWVENNIETYGDDEFLFGGYYGDFAYTNTFSTDKDEYVVSFSGEPRTVLTFEFAEIETLNGQWAFKEGKVRASGVLNSTFTASGDINFVSAEEVIFEPASNATLRPANPYLSIALPLNDQIADEVIALDAELTIVYPAINRDAEDGLTVEEVTLTRSVEIYGIGAFSSYDYYDYFNDYGNWKRSERIIKDKPGWIPLAALMLLGTIGAVVLVQRGALTDFQTGSIGIQVRRLSGLQMLGVQAHPLSQVSSVSVDSGVFLGLVIAQSPAGRAGLQSGDVLVAFGDKSINSPGQLNRVAGKVKRGDVVQVRVIREGVANDIFVRF
jgi:hypothetical protein